MQLKIRYDSFDQFFRLNEERFKRVQAARKELKSPQELGITGNALAESEKLAYHYLNLKNLVSDLLFGIGASVLDAKHLVKVQTAVAYRAAVGPVSEKKIMIEASPIVEAAVEKFNDLGDLKDYLENKREDFETCYYYYRKVSGGK